MSISGDFIQEIIRANNSLKDNVDCSQFPNLTYEDGIINALSWILN